MNIHQRINEVKKEVEYVKKDKKVESYWAVTHDMVTAQLRPHLIKHGINTALRQISGEIQDTGKATQRGSPITRYVAFYEMDFVNIDEPTDIMKTSIGSVAEDHSDKAPGKCASYAVKTLMLKTFLVETGESDESRVESDPIFIDKKDVEKINALIKEREVNVDMFLTWADVPAIENITTINLEKTINALKQKEKPKRQPGDE